MQETTNFTDTVLLKKMTLYAFAIKDSFLNLGQNIRKYDIFEVKGKKYLLPDGRFDVYEWKNNRWINLYKFPYNGYNFFSKKFVFRDEIYSYGGYGYWKTNGDLIKYLWNKNEWEMVSYGNKNPEGNGFAYLSDSTLYVISPLFYIDNYAYYRKKGNSFKINMNTLKTSNSDLVIDFEINTWLETKNFIISPHSKPVYAIDKRKNIVLTNQLHDFDCYRKESAKDVLIYSRNDSLFIYNKNFILVCSYDVEKEMAKFQPLRKKIGILFWLITISGLITISAFVLFYLKKKRIPDIVNNNAFDQPVIDELLKLTGKTITVDELDVILGIENIKHSETQRFKRSQMINAINQETKMKTGRELIHRIQDPEDKRRFLYDVNGLK